MVNFVGAGQLNLAALNSDDFYVQNIQPPSIITGAPTDVIGLVGTASWGPVGQPVLCGSGVEAASNFGPISSASLTDPYDMPSDFALAFGQAGSDASLQAWGVRVTDGTDTSATGTLSNSGTASAAQAAALYTGVLGNGLQIVISAGAQVNTFNAIVKPGTGASAALPALPELFPNLPSTGFFPALKNALANGISSIRGPSQLARLATVTDTTNPPLTGTFTLSGGADGRASVNTSKLVGSDAVYPKTGIFALRELNPPVGVVWIAGCTDATAAASLEALASQEGMTALFPFAAGTNTTTAQASAQSNGIADPSFTYVKDFVYWLDTINNQIRFSPPTAIIGGRIASLSPEQSPGNKGVNLVLGTERNPPNSPAVINYTAGELGLLKSAGITLITNPIPAGNQFGIRHSTSSSPSAVTQPIEYWRMTSFIARSAYQTMGQFVDQLQSQQPVDPLRQAVDLASNNFLERLKDLEMIDDYLVTCAFSSASNAKAGLGINTPASIAAHYLFCLWQVRYLSAVNYFVLSLQGGTTVVTVQQQAA